MKNLFIAVACFMCVGVYAAEETKTTVTTVNNYECKKCSLRPRPNTQPNQYEYYEDYLKSLEQAKQEAPTAAPAPAKR